jgi:hypothetical protein
LGPSAAWRPAAVPLPNPYPISETSIMDENIPFVHPDKLIKNKYILAVFLIGVGLIASLVIALSGDGNPALGTWKIEAESNPFLLLLTLSQDNNFRLIISKNKVVMTDGLKEETYPVYFKRENGRWYMCDDKSVTEIGVIDKNRITFKEDAPLAMGGITLVRAQ